MRDHFSPAPLDPATHTHTVQPSPQRTDDVSVVAANTGLQRSKTASMIKQMTARPDASSESSSQEDATSSLNSDRFARNVPADLRKINSFSPSSTSTTGILAYPSDSVAQTIQPNTVDQREPITAAKSHRVSQLANTCQDTDQRTCPLLAMTARLWQVPYDICDLDAAMPAQPDIAPHRS